jgi:hypothetical protein
MRRFMREDPEDEEVQGAFEDVASLVHFLPCRFAKGRDGSCPAGVPRVRALSTTASKHGRAFETISPTGWSHRLNAPEWALRFVGMTERLATAIRQQRHLRSRRVLCKDDGTPLTRQGAWSRVRYAAKRANVPTGVRILRHTSALTFVGSSRVLDTLTPSGPLPTGAVV